MTGVSEAGPRRVTGAAPPLLLAVAHGSRNPAAGAVAVRVAERAAGLAGAPSAVAFIDNAEPTPGAALDAAVAAGHTSVVVLPLLLTAATHSKTDVPGAVLAARGRHPGLRVAYGRPLLPSPLVYDALAARLAAAGATPDTAVVLASAGSADPAANADVAYTSRMLVELGHAADARPAYLSATRPGVADVVAGLRRDGHAHVAVARMMLAPGWFPDQAEKQARAAGADVVTDVLADHDAVVALVAERYREAIAGDLRMNCDDCMYRVPLAGRASRVGAPQLERG